MQETGDYGAALAIGAVFACLVIAVLLFRLL